MSSKQIHEMLNNTYSLLIELSSQLDNYQSLYQEKALQLEHLQNKKRSTLVKSIADKLRKLSATHKNLFRKEKTQTILAMTSLIYITKHSGFLGFLEIAYAFTIPVHCNNKYYILRQKKIRPWKKNKNEHITTTTEDELILNINEVISRVQTPYILILSGQHTIQNNTIKAAETYLNNNSEIDVLTPKVTSKNKQLIKHAGEVIDHNQQLQALGQNIVYNHYCAFEYCYISAGIYADCFMLRVQSWNKAYTKQCKTTEKTSSLQAFINKNANKIIYYPDFTIALAKDPTPPRGIISYPMHEQLINKAHYEKTRVTKKETVLIIDWRTPTYDEDAGSKTTFQYINLLIELGYVVKLIPNDFEYRHQYTKELQLIGVEVLYGEKYPRWENWLKHVGKYIDIVYLNRAEIAAKYIPAIKKYTSAHLAYYCHDLAYIREARMHALNKTMLSEKKIAQDTIISDAVINNTNVTVVCSVDEQKLLTQAWPNKKILFKPAYFYNQLPGAHYIADQRSHLLFVGGYNHQPNQDALQWFVFDIYPLIRKIIPNIQLYIVGANYTWDFKKRVSAPGIIYLGKLSDKELEQQYQSRRIVVAPLRAGAGIKGKVFEAFYHGVPVVSTNIGLEGFPEIKNILKGYQTAKDFAQQIIQAYNNFTALSEVSDKQLNYIKKHFSRNKAERAILEIFDKVDSNSHC